MEKEQSIETEVITVTVDQQSLGGITAEQKMIIGEAKSLGYALNRPLCRMVQKGKDGKTFDFIGKIPFLGDDLSGTWGLVIDKQAFDDGESHTLLTFHVIATTKDNPLSLHWRQHAGQEPKVTIEGLEKVQSVTGAENFAKKLYALLPHLKRILKPRAGRPEGTTAHTDDEQIRIGMEAIELRKRGKKGWKGTIRDKYNISDRTIDRYLEKAKSPKID